MMELATMPTRDSFCCPPNTALRTPEMGPISYHQAQQQQQEDVDAGFKWSAPIAKNMADMIHSQVRDMLRQSRLVRQAEGIELIRREDIFEVNQVLGSGAFSQVSAIKLRDGRRYACKHLKQKLMDQPDNFRLAAAEMACEAHMLASFDHPHILKIRGWAYNGIASFEEGYHNSFFLLLDQLDETLDNRITRWTTEEQQRQQLILTNPTVYDEHYHQNMYVEKLRILLGIGSALEYLHERGVIFRDLKPNNIGFLNGNQVQLFDFGLSRELPQLDTSQKFEMSGKVGTLRYMAPEVACHQKYNVSADVYSFAMVAYEMCSLQKPFDGWTRDMHSNLVCERGMRPDTSLIATTVLPDVLCCNGVTSTTCNRVPIEMRVLLEHAWSEDPCKRPTVPQITAQVQLLREQQMLMLEEHVIRQQVLQIQQQQQQEQQHHAVMAAAAVAAVTATAAPPTIYYMDMEHMDPHMNHHRQHLPHNHSHHHRNHSTPSSSHHSHLHVVDQQLHPQHHQPQPQLGDQQFPFVIDISADNNAPAATNPSFCYDVPLQQGPSSPPRCSRRKMVRTNSFDSIGTIETESLSAESQELFF